MFSKTDRNEKPDRIERATSNTPPRTPGAKSRNAAPSLVSANLQVVGNLNTEGEIQIDGTVEGDITCNKLTVGESATISGEINADEIEVRGRVQGRIRARAVLLSKSANVTGDVWHDTLSIESGAFLEGHCKRNDSATTPAAPKPAEPAPAATGGGTERQNVKT